jgi:hypothetical protein
MSRSISVTSVTFNGLRSRYRTRPDKVSPLCFRTSNEAEPSNKYWPTLKPCRLKRKDEMFVRFSDT